MSTVYISNDIKSPCNIKNVRRKPSNPVGDVRNGLNGSTILSKWINEIRSKHMSESI